MTQGTDKPDEGSAAAALPGDETAALGAARADPTPPAGVAAAPLSSASIASTAAATAEAAAVTAEAAAVTAATAATAAAPVLQPDPDDDQLLERDRLTHPKLAVAVMALFLIAAVANMNLFQIESAINAQRVNSLAATALGLVTTIWFIRCFTGDARQRITDIFVFAYAFTIGSFATLVLPFVTESPTLGDARPAILELVRGCVRDNAMGGLGGVSAVVLCPSDGPKGEPWPNRRQPNGKEEPNAGPLRYALMLAIGGVTATVIDAPATASAGAATAASSGASAPPIDNGATLRHHEVIGGLAVPFFVLVMAFIGGAVSLSRRIPEYQRRLHPNYIPTEKEGRMRPFEAREVVVFQIMQLVSAPFLAVATWFIVSPMSLTAAATLAFGTGFASEPLLLMIRGLVEGIRPASTVAKPAVEPKPDPQPADEAAPAAVKPPPEGG
jgi:cell division septation protein DedD